jgi:hypothetical protein
MIEQFKILAFVSFTAVAACAAPPPAPFATFGQSTGPQCFLANEVDGYTSGPDGFTNVKVAGNHWFAMHLGSDCPSMDWLMQIAIRPRDSNWLCEGRAARLIAPDPTGLHRDCVVSGIRELAPSEVASLPPTFVRSTVRT